MTINSNPQQLAQSVLAQRLREYTERAFAHADAVDEAQRTGTPIPSDPSLEALGLAVAHAIRDSHAVGVCDELVDRIFSREGERLLGQRQEVAK